jgi:hypothetical protein
MVQHLYSLVRCVPNPNTGEYVNLGALVGDPATGQWRLRLLSDPRRASRFAGAAAYGACQRYLAQLTAEIDESWEALMHGSADALGRDWLDAICSEHRNVVQFSDPLTVVAENVDAATDKIFEHRIIDPLPEARQRVLTKHTLRAAMRDAYRAEIEQGHVNEAVDLVVGDNVHTVIDFAVANGKVVQVTQAWSFQLAGYEDVSTQVKSWAYAIERLRSRDASKILRPGGVSEIDDQVDVRVIVAEPQSKRQEEIHAEAIQVFRQVRASIHSWEHADDVAREAAALLRS